MTSSVDIYAPAADLVRRLLDADAHHDLARYRALLDDEFIELTEGEVVSRRGDDAAYTAARSWALAPSAYRRIDDINEAAGCVTVRYQLERAVPVGIAVRERPGKFLGYSIYETREGHIIRAAHFFSEQREAPGPPPEATEYHNAASTEAALADTGPPRELSTRRRTHWQRLLSGLTVLLSMLVAEPVWAAPVVATTAWRGGGLAFGLFVPLYFALGYGAALVVIRRARTSTTSVGWLERWLSEGSERRYLQRVRRLVQAGTFVGFVLSSMLFGGIVTTWLLLQLGRRRHIRRDAMASSLIFSIWLVGFYAGIASLIF